MTDSPSIEKVDPETLVLRAKPRRIIRIKRNLLIAGTAIGCVTLAGLTWLGLSPSLIHPTTPVDQDKNPEKHGVSLPDQISALPKSYADVPQLGDPLPGDLGRPILEHRRLHGGDSADPEGKNLTAMAGPTVEAARSSGLFFQLAMTNPISPAETVTTEKTAGNDPSLMALGAATSSGPAPSAKVAFSEGAGRPSTRDPHALMPGSHAGVVMAGTVISAALITGLNSDLPGMVLAQITRDVPDLTGRNIAIPQGTKLIGKYDSSVSYGQSRALIVWQRLIWPDGRSLEIDNTPATDSAGFAGLSDGVSFHTVSLLKGIGLSTLLGMTGELGKSSDDDLIKALRASVQDASNQAGQQFVSRQLDFQPTLTVRPGWPLRVIVQKDLVINDGQERAGL